MILMGETGGKGDSKFRNDHFSGFFLLKFQGEQSSKCPQWNCSSLEKCGWFDVGCHGL